MKKSLAIFALLLAVFAPSREAHALPPDLDPPPAAFGDAERDGTLLVTDDLREVDFGGGVRLPVRWVYRSSDQSTNAYGWDGFSLTIAESKAVKKTAVLYEVTLLCGKVIYFAKQVPGVEPQWKSNDGQWAGLEAADEEFTISRWDGWKLEFLNGRIKKLITDSSRTLVWTYDGADSRLVANIREVGQDPKLEMVFSSDPLKMAGSSAVRGAYQLEVNGDTYSFKYSGGTLKDIEFPDGRKTQWRFESNGGIAAEKRLTLTQEFGWWRSWVFFTETRKLKTDDAWSYSITGGEPSDDGMVYNRPTMERTRIATGEKQKVVYEASNSIISATDVMGTLTKTFLYKTPGKLYDKIYKVERKRAGESAFTTVWRGTYDAATGDLIRSYDLADNATEYFYERFAGASEFQPPKKEKTTDPLGRVSTIERDIAGNIVEEVDEAGVERKYEWDARHRMTRVMNATNDVLLRYVYGDKDEVLERYDALGNKTAFEYSVHLGEPLVTKRTSPLGKVTTTTRDAKGRITQIEGPSGAKWQYAYVAGWNEVETATDPLNNETDYEYDSRLNETKVTDPDGQETVTEYDDLDNPKLSTDALNQTTAWEWSADRDIKKLTDPRSKVYIMSWESPRERKELKWPDTASQTLTFDHDGKVTSYKPRGTHAVVTNAWNEADEVTGQSWVNGAYSGTASLSRNASGQVTGGSTSAMGLTVSGSYAYDSRGRLSAASQTIGGVTRQAGVTYDLEDRISTITYPAGFVVELARNADGQISSVKKDGTTLATYAYDLAGRLSTRTLSSGAVTTYSYDGADRVTQIAVTSGSATLWAERYGYNAVGLRIFTLTGTAGTVGDAYDLDAVAQLKGVKYGASGANAGYATAVSPFSWAEWTYDGTGNRLTEVKAAGTTNYLVNAINQYTEITGAASSTPTYSSRGDLVTNQDWQFGYDAFGNLIRAHHSGSNTLLNYWRDVFDHRAVKEVNGSKVAYFNLGAMQLERYDLTSANATSIIHEPGIDKPLAEVDASGNLTFFHQDWLGSVVLLTNASGSTVQSFAYDAWGRPSGRNGSGVPIADASFATPLLYTAREYEAETGLYHYRARAYSPELGRFLQMDPIDFDGGGANMLAYVSNNPFNFTDASGLTSEGNQRSDEFRNKTDQEINQRHEDLSKKGKLTKEEKAEKKKLDKEKKARGLKHSRHSGKWKKIVIRGCIIIWAWLWG